MEGMNIRQCVTVTDPQRGIGYRMVSREIFFYLDPKTNEVLRSWQNPYTGKTVEVMHIANDPVHSRPSFPIGADGKPYSITLTRMGDMMLMPLKAPLHYINPLVSDYRDYVGKGARYRHPLGQPHRRLGANSDWMPWMMMERRDG